MTQQLWTYVQMPALALGAAVSAMAAQNIGAGRWDRVSRITRAGIICNLAMTGTLVALLYVVERHALGLFLGADSPALPIAMHIQRVASWGFVLFGVTFVVFGTVRANGAVYGPLVILFVALFPVRLGAMLAFMPAYGVEAIWWTMPFGSVAAMLMSLCYYRWGRWRRGGMIAPRGLQQARDETAALAEPGGRLHPTS